MFEKKKPQLYAPRGFSFNEQQEPAQQHFDPELAPLEESILANPKNIKPYISYAEVMLRRGELDLAWSMLEKALLVSPNNVDALTYSGFIAHKRKDQDKAEQLFKHAISIAPEDSSTLLQYGAFLQEQGKLGKAWEIFDKLLQVDSNNLSALLVQSTLAHGYKEDTVLAHFLVDKALALAPDMRVGWIYKWNYFLDTADYSGFKAYAPPKVADELLLCLYKLYQCLFGALFDPNYSLGSAKDFSLPHPDNAPDLLSVISHINNLESYRKYLASIADSYQQQDLRQPLDASLSPMYLIGDSHILGHGHQAVRSYVLRPLLAMGTKMFHLANGIQPYSSVFKRLLESVPKKAPVAISVGEIDCRTTEGFVPFFIKNKMDTTTKEQFINKVVKDYISFVRVAAGSRPITIIGVPAILFANSNNPSAEEELAAQVVIMVNNSLHKQTQKYGMGFVDLYAITIASGNHYADKWHLLPQTIAKAWLQQKEI